MVCDVCILGGLFVKTGWNPVRVFVYSFFLLGNCIPGTNYIIVYGSSIIGERGEAPAM